VAQAVSRSLSPEEVLEGALTRTLENLGLSLGWVHLIEPGSGHLT
jgi:hypothetical protein